MGVTTLKESKREEENRAEVWNRGEILSCLTSPSLSQLRAESVWGKANDSHFHT